MTAAVCSELKKSLKKEQETDGPMKEVRLYLLLLFLTFSSTFSPREALPTVIVEQVHLFSGGEFTLFDIWSELSGKLQVGKGVVGDAHRNGDLTVCRALMR